ncbi:MAG: glycosyltransferase, partial [Bacilli bacterium]|nr:glycosyltransferase [Bacilli bacterium]
MVFKFFPEILPEINFGEILSLINYIVFAILAIIYFHHNLFLILSIFFKKKKYKEASHNHFYAFIISARNEEKVIGNLIDSIKAQDYPADLYKIYVIADNCTDNTASIAKEKGANVIERFNTELIGKSYALDEVLKYAI